MAAAPAGAQLAEVPPLTRAQFGVGYVANAPEAMLGGNVYVILPRWGGIGFYVDAKFDTSNPSDQRGYDAGVTAADVENQIGGQFVRSERSWWSANVAVLRPISSSFVGYLGAGLATRTAYNLYQLDEDAEAGFGGVVWAEDPRAEATSPNFMFGAIMRLTPMVSTQFGYETEPGGLTVGAALRIPRW